MIEFPAGLIGLGGSRYALVATEDFSCNLRTPIVIGNGRGHQVINEAEDALVRAPLFAEAAETVQAA